MFERGSPVWGRGRSAENEETLSRLLSKIDVIEDAQTVDRSINGYHKSETVIH